MKKVLVLVLFGCLLNFFQKVSPKTLLFDSLQKLVYDSGDYIFMSGVSNDDAIVISRKSSQYPDVGDDTTEKSSNNILGFSPVKSKAACCDRRVSVSV